LKEINFTDLVKDAHTVLALQTAKNLAASNIYVVGYDGYQEGYISKTELALAKENEQIFKDFQQDKKHNLTSFTSTHYRNLHVESIYSFLK
jgi:4-hydroxy 2-oxovalerate aldolase